MATDYTIFVGQHEVETITIATTRFAEEMAPINEFKRSLTEAESRLFFFVSEYQLESLQEKEMEELEIGIEADDDYDYDDHQDYSFECCEPQKTPEEDALIKKVLAFLES